jgi:hypothetical protein
VGQIVDALRRARTDREAVGRTPAGAEPRAFRLVAVLGDGEPLGRASVAAHLARRARELRADLPVLVLPLDGSAPEDAGRAAPLGELLASPADLVPVLTRCGVGGLVVVDAPDAEPLARGVLGACDLAVFVVRELASLDRAQRALGWLRDAGGSPSRARLVLSLRDPARPPAGAPDELALVLRELRRRRWPHVAALLSRPRDGAGASAPDRLPGEIANRQLRAVADELLDALGATGEGAASAATRPRDPAESTAWGGGSARAFHRFLLGESTGRDAG